MLGIGIPTQVVRLNPVDSARLDKLRGWKPRSILDLFNPQHTMEMLENTTSIVGISGYKVGLKPRRKAPRHSSCSPP